MDLTVCRSRDTVIAVVGSTGCGKSSFISKCTGQEIEIAHGLSPCKSSKSIESTSVLGY
jgi:ABC-type phosphate transport system ATPase subunit